jgi:hypothetical protein
VERGGGSVPYFYLTTTLVCFLPPVLFFSLLIFLFLFLYSSFFSSFPLSTLLPPSPDQPVLPSSSHPSTSLTMAASALLRSRVRRPSYLNRLAKAEDLIDLFPNGSYIGWSGFTGVGYPK